MLYLIGIGLDKKDLSIKAIEALKKCDNFFIDNYTTYLPFSIKSYERFLQKLLGRKIRLEVASRSLLEEKSDELLELAKKHNVALLVYGDPLVATTHYSLISGAKKEKIGIVVIHNASIINAIADVGLSIYKFGKVASMPRWQEGYKPLSFYQTIKENLSINAHTLLLVDANLSYEEALKQLQEIDEKLLKNAFVCQSLGSERARIYFEPAKAKIKQPFCFVIPAKLEWYEQEAIANFKSQNFKKEQEAQKKKA
jgi:diphthine synthase